MANQLLAKFEENTRNPAALKQVMLYVVTGHILLVAEPGWLEMG